eukprot:2214594-Alexandrium_andersonii.AAC.1
MPAPPPPAAAPEQHRLPASEFFMPHACATPGMQHILGNLLNRFASAVAIVGLARGPAQEHRSVDRQTTQA